MRTAHERQDPPAAYYACAPRKAYLPAGHPAPGGVFIREDHLLEKVNAFLSDHVFGDYRHQLLDADLRQLDATVAQEREQLETQLAEVEQRILAAPNPGLLDALPVMKIEVDQLSEDLARALFEALRLEIRYNRDTHTATCRVTLTGPTITAANRTAHDAAVISLNDARQRRERRNKMKRNRRHPRRVTILFPSLWCPPVRFERTLDGF